MGGGGGEGESGEDAVEEEGVGGVWWGTWNGVGVGVAALEKALLDGAGESDDHLGWAAELGGFKIDADTADAASESCNESLPGHACGFTLSLWWGAVGDEETVGGDAWRCMRTVHDDVADVFGGAGTVEVAA